MSPEAAGRGCAAESLGRGEPIGATASRVRRWLLVEQPGPWGADALAESRLDRSVARRLGETGLRLGIRVVLIRRAGWRPGGPGLAAFLAHTTPGGGWIERLSLEHPRQLLDLDLAAVSAADAPGLGEPGPSGGVRLVCTNGVHDRCCADLGRPVVRALDAAGTADLWECSHIGGDRFAANLVCLPSGVYLGRVPPDRAAAMVDDLSRGRLDLDHYRGRSCYPPLVQAAEIFARRELGERRLHALRPVATARRRPDALRVVLAGPDGGRVEATVARVRAEPAHLTCRAAHPSPPWHYRLEHLSVRPRQPGP